MRTVIFLLILASTCLGSHNGFNLNLKHDGPVVIGGKINFIAELSENGKPASGTFRYDWEDNVYNRNTESHESTSPVDVWTVKYSKNKVPIPGKYVTTVTVRKLTNSQYVPVARLQIKFEIKGASGDKQIHPILSQSWADYKRNKILRSQNYALDNIVDPRVRSIVSQRINLINDRIPIMSSLYQTPSTIKKREDNSVNLDDIIKYKREKILDSQNRELNYIVNPSVLSTVSERINAINSEIPIMQDSFTIPLERHNKKIEDLGESEQYVLDAIQEPTIKEAVKSRIIEENKRVPYLSKPDDVARFSDALDVIHKKIKEIQKSQKVTLKNIKDTEKRDQMLKEVNDENKWLETKSKEIDSKLTDSLKTIHKKMEELKQIEAEVLENIEDPVLKEKLRFKLEKQTEKVTSLLDSTEQSTTPISELNDSIKELELAEMKAVESISDPVVKSIVLNKLDEQNQEIPNLLKSEDSSEFSNSINTVRKEINSEISKSNDVILDNKDSSISDQITPLNEKSVTQSKDMGTTIALSLAEIREKIAALKKLETKAKKNSTATSKKEVINVINEQNKKIPTLLLPNTIDTNFTEALDEFNAKIANLSNFIDAVSVNVTNPFVLSKIQSKMNFVNYKLISKYNQLKDNFTALLDQMATESGSTDTQQTVKTPRLTSMLGGGMFMPQIQTLVEQKMAAKQVPLNTLFGETGTGTDGVIPNLIADKFAARNQIMQAKANMVNAGLATAMTAIRAKVAALKAFEEQAVANISDPEIQDELHNVIDEENQKVPLLLLPYGLDANFTKALDAFHTKIDGLKNSVDTITANISIPAIKAAVTSKFDFVNAILMNKYSQLDSNFTSILEKIKARFANLTDQSINEPEIYDDEARPVPILTKPVVPSPVFNFSKISNLIKSKMTGKQKITNSTLFGVKDPAAKSVILDKMTELNNNLSVIADKIAENFTKIMDAISNKTNELQEMETLILDNIDDSDVQAVALAQIEEENKKIPSLTLSKRSSKKKDDEVVVPPKPSIFKVRVPYLIRF